MRRCGRDRCAREAEPARLVDHAAPSDARRSARHCRAARQRSARQEIAKQSDNRTPLYLMRRPSPRSTPTLHSCRSSQRTVMRWLRPCSCRSSQAWHGWRTSSAGRSRPRRREPSVARPVHETRQQVARQPWALTVHASPSAYGSHRDELTCTTRVPTRCAIAGRTRARADLAQ